MFNRTDMRIYQELFPGREIKAQKFFDLNTTTPMMRSPSYTVKGARGRDTEVSILSNNGGKQPRRSSVIGSNQPSKRSNSQLRLNNKPRDIGQQIDAA